MESLPRYLASTLPTCGTGYSILQRKYSSLGTWVRVLAMLGEEVFDLEAEGCPVLEPSPLLGSEPSPPSSPGQQVIKEVDGVELSRKAIVVQEEEEGVCPICLDEFTEADPGIPTTCG